MRQELNALYHADGIAALRDLPCLQSSLLKRGVAPWDVYALLLCLSVSPSLLSFAGREITPEEEATAVDHIARNTCLTQEKARELAGTVLDAVEAKRAVRVQHIYNGMIGLRRTSYGFRRTLLFHFKRGTLSRASCTVRAVTPSEEEEVERMIRDLSSISKEKKQFDLTQISLSGNGQACYDLGVYYLNEGTETKDSLAYECFCHAAELGYPPAYGALAAYEIDSGANMDLAAHFFFTPGAMGSGNRSWYSYGEKLLAYRKANNSRIRLETLISGISLLFTIVCCAISLGFWSVLAVLISLSSLLIGASSLWQRALYRSMVLPSCLPLLSWLIFVFVLLR